MRKIGYFCAMILLLVQCSRATAQGPVPQIHEADLRKTPIAVGPLRITITDFKVGWMRMLIENPSDSFVTFSPSRLVFMSIDGSQVDIFGDDSRDRDLPPGSHIKARDLYYLDGQVDLPGRLFYDEHEIADIVK